MDHFTSILGFLGQNSGHFDQCSAYKEAILPLLWSVNPWFHRSSIEGSGPILEVLAIDLGWEPGFGPFSAYFGGSGHISDSSMGSGPGFGPFLASVGGVFGPLYT